MKDTLEAEEIEPPELAPLADNRGPDLLLGGALPRASRAEILSSLPQRSVVDVHVREFLDTVDMGAGKRLSVCAGISTDLCRLHPSTNF